MRYVSLALFALLTGLPALQAEDALWITYPGGDGPGKGKKIVLMSGDEEYRSEEGLPQLGKILSVHHGFECVVLFSINPETGEIDPNEQKNIPGLHELDDADLLISLNRFRNLPDDQMKHVVDYVESGRPVIGLRTATHAFNLDGNSSYGHYSWRSKDWDGGFGRQVLGETWISHHGHHGKESTLGIVVEGQENNPILRGIKAGDIWGPTDVYGVRLPLPGDSQPLVLGQVLSGMTADSAPVEGAKNSPMMPVAWTRTFTGKAGKAARVFTTTMGASQDLSSEGVRRMIVNAAYWALGMEDQIPAKSNVEIVGEYNPTPFGFNKFTKGVKPSAHALK